MNKAFLLLLLPWQPFCPAQAPAAPAPQAGHADRRLDFDQLSKTMARRFMPEAITSPGEVEAAPLGTFLIRNGTIYLSAHEAIVLALNNNLDITSARLLGPIAQSDIKRAAAGQLLRNVPTRVANGPSSASGPLTGASAIGDEDATNGQSELLSGLSVQLAGSQIPQLDPIFYGTGLYSFTNHPEANQVVSGTNTLVTQTQVWQGGFQKAYLTGTSFDVNFTSLRLSQNAPRNMINPSITADLALKVQQPLLQGASIKANMRAIHIAKNNQTVSELTWRQQVSATITQVLTLYYDLVAYRDQLQISQKALAESRKLLEDNRQRLELGVLSQADVIDSEAAVDSAKQLVEGAAIQVQQQEMTLKSVLTRKGLEDPVVVNASLVPTDHFVLPGDSSAEESIESIADRAIRQRYEVEEGEIEMRSKELSLLGTREALKPVLNIYMALQSNALVGSLNPLSPSSQQNPSSPFIGGFGLALQQIGKAAYPDYEFGFRLNVPLTNRAARADMTRDEIDMQQQQIETQQMKNGIRLQALRGALSVRQARRQYNSSVELRKLRQNELTQEQKMFDLGTLSVGQLINAHKNLELSQQQEVAAHNTYARALISLDAVLNETLEHNQVVLDEAAADRKRLPIGQ